MIKTDNISIITNFGCALDCWYCIWKNHPLHTLKQTMATTDWDKLHQFLFENKSKLKVSISGGGDPLYQYVSNKTWWEKLIHCCNSLGMLIDVHTREKLKDDLFWKTIHRCSFSSDQLKDDIEHLFYLCQVTQVRITHVVTAKTTDSLIQDYINFCMINDCQLTLKELALYNDHQKYIKLKRLYPDLFYLDSADYNNYFMPDNKVYSVFNNSSV